MLIDMVRGGDLFIPETSPSNAVTSISPTRYRLD
jgi:hypothetical protein